MKSAYIPAISQSVFFSWESLGILLIIRHCFISYDPTKIPMNSAGNLRKIPEESTWKFPLNFPVDSCLTDNPNFCGDSPPPRIHHPQVFPAESARFSPLGWYRRRKDKKEESRRKKGRCCVDWSIVSADIGSSKDFRSTEGLGEISGGAREMHMNHDGRS